MWASYVRLRRGRLARPATSEHIKKESRASDERREA
jgi:hypothetical protein